MRYFLVVLFCALWHAILARGMHDNPVFHDLERRLVRLEDRQLSENENIEHRILQLERQLGTPQEDEKYVPIQLESNFYKVDGHKASNEMELMERLEKIEKNWQNEMEGKLVEFFSKYDTLDERLSSIENRVKEGNVWNTEDKRTWKVEINEEALSALKKFKKIGAKYYFIEQNKRLEWHEALDHCKTLKSRLVSLQNNDEWEAIRNHLDSDMSYWVDVNDIIEKGVYMSGTSGRKAPFLKWEAREPNHLSFEEGNEHCVELRRDYDHYMNDMVCTEKNYYICELISPF